MDATKHCLFNPKQLQGALDKVLASQSDDVPGI